MPEPLHSGIMLGVAVGTVGAFQSAMPKPPDLLSASPVDPTEVAAVRAAELHALVGAAIIGTIGSIIVRSGDPLWVAGIVSVALIGVNEWTLRRTG